MLNIDQSWYIGATIIDLDYVDRNANSFEKICEKIQKEIPPRELPEMYLATLWWNVNPNYDMDWRHGKPFSEECAEMGKEYGLLNTREFATNERLNFIMSHLRWMDDQRVVHANVKEQIGLWGHDVEELYEQRVLFEKWAVSPMHIKYVVVGEPNFLYLIGGSKELFHLPRKITTDHIMALRQLNAAIKLIANLGLDKVYERKGSIDKPVSIDKIDFLEDIRK